MNKTWIELLGVPQFNEYLDGCDVVREVDLHRFKILWSFDTPEEAKEGLDSWLKEYENINDEHKQNKS